jgi:hypothetical protein
MAQGNHVRRFLAGHDSGDAGQFQYITLLHLSVSNQALRFRQHLDGTPGAGDSMRHGLFANIDHSRLTSVIKVWQIGHGNHETCEGALSEQLAML